MNKLVPAMLSIALLGNVAAFAATPPSSSKAPVKKTAKLSHKKHVKKVRSISKK